MPFSRMAILPFAAVLCGISAMAGSIEITDIRTFSVPFGTFLDDVAINDQGDIVGTSFDVLKNIPQAGFLIPANGGPPVQIKYPGAPYTFVYGINDQGVAVGSAFNGKTYVGFTEKNGSFTTFEVGTYTFPGGINNHGDITGYFGSTEGNETGFLLEDHTKKTFSVPGYPFETAPAALNNCNQITGYYNFSGFNGFLRNPDGSFEFFDFSGFGINEAGIIVGMGAGPNDSAIGGVRIGETSYTYEYPGALDTYLYGINNHDEVVGFYDTPGSSNETIFKGKLVYVDKP
jgi:hypothetical protein